MNGEAADERNQGALIVHLCQRKAWLEARACGMYRTPSLEFEGFIHCSHAGQILKVANVFYRDMQDLVLLWIDAGKVEAEIRWERVGADNFPHIYGELNVDAVVKVSDLNPDEDGRFHTI